MITQKNDKYMDIIHKLDEIGVGELKKYSSDTSCSHFGISFVKCITNTFVTESMIIDNMLPEDHFWTRISSNETMVNTQKLFYNIGDF